jgi:hypothetical protein
MATLSKVQIISTQAQNETQNKVYRDLVAQQAVEVTRETSTRYSEALEIFVGLAPSHHELAMPKALR